MIQFNVNNGRFLFMTQAQEDGPTRVYTTNGKTIDYDYAIPAGDMVMLLNFYRYIKDNDIQNDFINPCGKNGGIANETPVK